jgi:predicted nucleic-acid-binding Zn-ribbon protein
MTDIYIKCCRCRSKHWESERVSVPHKSMLSVSNLVCPKCSATSYYKIDEAHWPESAEPAVTPPNAVLSGCPPEDQQERGSPSGQSA